MNLLVRRGTTNARVAWSRWVGDCTVCPSALWLSTLQPEFTCWDCGQQIEVVWPSPSLIAGVERLLSMRPDPTTRSWYPGETLNDLLLENMQYGVIPGFETAPSGLLLQVVDDKILTDALPSFNRYEIGA
jgi:hypothetical protein